MFAIVASELPVKINAMSSSSLWPRFQKYFLRYDDLDFSIDISRMRFADDFFGEDADRGREGVCRHARAGGRRDRQPGRGADGRPLLAARFKTRANAGAPRRTSSETNARIKHSPPTCTAGRSRRQNGNVQAHPADRHRRVGPRARNSSPTPSANANDPLDIYFLDNTDPDGFDRVLAQDRRSPCAHAGGRDLQIRRHEGDAQRHAGSRSALRAGRPRFRKARRRRHRSRQRAGQVRGKERLAHAFPDVRLGRRPHVDHERGRPRAGGAAGLRHRQFSRRRGGDGCEDTRRRTRDRTRPCCSP